MRAEGRVRVRVRVRGGAKQYWTRHPFIHPARAPRYHRDPITPRCAATRARGRSPAREGGAAQPVCANPALLQGDPHLGSGLLSPPHTGSMARARATRTFLKGRCGGADVGGRGRETIRDEAIKGRCGRVGRRVSLKSRPGGSWSAVCGEVQGCGRSAREAREQKLVGEAEG